MPLKDISYLELLQPHCSVDRNYLCNLCREHHEEQLCEIIVTGPVDQEKSFKDSSYLELWWPLCTTDWIHLCNFGRMHHEE